MDAPQEEFYSKPETEVWIAFECRGPKAQIRLLQERRAWGSRASLESLDYDHVVLMVRLDGAWEFEG